MLRKDATLLPRAIEEMLRYDPPAQSTDPRHQGRRADRRDVEIKAASAVFVVLAAANRDPAQFPDPERFDITRDPNDHLAFGDGIHFCIGAALARLEALIVIGATLERFPRLRLAEPAADAEVQGLVFSARAGRAPPGDRLTPEPGRRR